MDNPVYYNRAEYIETVRAPVGILCQTRNNGPVLATI